MRKTLMITILAIVLVLAMGVSVFATTPNLDELDAGSGSNGLTDNEIPAINVANENANENANQNTTPDKLADTGLSIYALPVIGIVVVASIYAYKKVKEYNI